MHNDAPFRVNGFSGRELREQVGRIDDFRIPKNLRICVRFEPNKTDTFKPASWDFTFFRKTALMMLLIGFVNWMYEYTANQNVVQRYCASKSTADARKAVVRPPTGPRV